LPPTFGHPSNLPPNHLPQNSPFSDSFRFPERPKIKQLVAEKSPPARQNMIFVEGGKWNVKNTKRPQKKTIKV
jgi:hypothetical protein